MRTLPILFSVFLLLTSCEREFVDNANPVEDPTLSTKTVIVVDVEDTADQFGNRLTSLTDPLVVGASVCRSTCYGYVVDDLLYFRPVGLKTVDYVAPREESAVESYDLYWSLEEMSLGSWSVIDDGAVRYPADSLRSSYSKFDYYGDRVQSLLYQGGTIGDTLRISNWWEMKAEDEEVLLSCGKNEFTIVL